MLNPRSDRVLAFSLVDIVTESFPYRLRCFNLSSLLLSSTSRRILRRTRMEHSCHREPVKGKKCPLVGGFGYLELCLYGLMGLA